ncbi:MAG: DNA primase [Spirochaetes bacterium]|nr:DNA primase [Spirochaetota bacterium]
MIPKSIIQEIKGRIDIVAIVNDYIHNLKKSGKNWVGLCPFHNDRNPSFNVSPDLGIFKCFSCGESGDIISFVQKIEKVSFNDAVEILAKKAGVELNFLKEDDQQSSLKDRESLVQFNARLIKLFQHFLLSSKEGSEALIYLKNRGLNQELIKFFNIGYAPKGYNRLLKFLLKKGFKEDFLLNTGLFNKGEKGIKSIFFDRIIFPIFNHNEECIGFGGRALLKDAKPKYINTSETALYKKSYNLYGINSAKNIIREEKKVYLVEGYMDVVSCYKAGLKNVVAPCGTAVTKDQILLLNRYADEIILLMDGDDAGKKGVEKALKESINIFINKSVIVLPEGLDPDDYFKKYGIEDFKNLEKNKIDGFDFLVKYYTENTDKKDLKRIINALNSLFDYINQWESDVIRNNFIERTAELLSLDKGMLAKEYLTFKNKIRNYKNQDINEIEKDKGGKNNAKSPDNRLKREIDLFIFLIQIPDGSELVKQCGLREEHFLNSLTQNLYKNYIIEKNDDFIKNFMNCFDDDNIKTYVQNRLFSNEIKQNENIIKNSIIDRIIDIIKYYYKITNLKINEKLKLGQFYKDEELIKELQEEKTIIINEILKLTKLQELKK